MIVVVALLAGAGGMAGAQTAPPPGDSDQPALDPPPGGDPTSPVVVLPPLIEEMERLLAGSPADPARRTALGEAIAAANQALTEYTDGSTDLPAVIGAIAKAARHLQAVAPRDDADARTLQSLADNLVALPRTMAAQMVDLAAANGLDAGTLDSARRSIARAEARLAAGNYGGAAQSFGEGLKIVSNSLHFDMDWFEHEIENSFVFTGGYAYTINQGGQLARSGAEGFARTIGDPPVTPQSPAKEQHLASVSKTVTGVAMLRALQDKGISVESPIAPYLPKTWSLGDNVEDLQFRHLFNHRSGITGSRSLYSDLRTVLAGDLPALPAGFQYSNRNFGLMRILIPRVVASPDVLPLLDQIDDLADVFGDAGPANFAYSSIFENYVRTTIFQPIGIDGLCRSSDPNDTREYNWPPDQQPGYREPNWLLECGGYGWFLSSDNLGAFMAHLRYTSTLLKPATRATMDTLFLGWLDPTRYGWSTGTSGTYHNHGGDWYHGPGQAHTCMMKFPINVEASIVINSERGWIPEGGSGPHQCTLLKQAFEASWRP